jgi:tRNA threonylcarbamoyladenosine biosynthesis protein TsaB
VAEESGGCVTSGETSGFSRAELRSYRVLILALDTTTRAGSAAVTRDDEVLSLVEGDGTRTHGERLPQELDRVLTQAGVQSRDLALLVVASGPGAFTGLRIGLAAIQGLAMVRGVPVVGVSALDALALTVESQLDASQTTLVTWMDAARGEVFSLEFHRREMTAAADANDSPLLQSTADAIVATPAAILTTLDRSRARSTVFVGDGAKRYRGDIDAWSEGRSRVFDTPISLAPALASLGRRLAAKGGAGPPHALQPLYVRRPDAELERLRRS